MAALAKVLWLMMVMLVPGGLLALCSFFLARAVWHTWQGEHEAAGTAKLMKVMSAVRFRDVLREARATF